MIHRVATSDKTSDNEWQQVIKQKYFSDHCFRCRWFLVFFIKGLYTWCPWKLSNFQDPQPPCSSISKILPPPWPWTSNFKWTLLLPSRTNDNQSMKRKHNPRMTLICYHALPSGQLFFFSINSLILSGFPLTFFDLAKVSLCAFSWLYTLVCVVIQKYHKICLIYNYSHF